MASTDVFPPFNLPLEGIPWARAAQDRIIEGEISENQLTQKVDNGLRSTSGQLAVLARQINALSDTVRALPVTAANQVSIVNPRPPVTAWTNLATFSIPNTGAKSNAVVSISVNELLQVVSTSGPAPYGEVQIVVNGVSGPIYRMSRLPSTSANDFYFASTIGESHSLSGLTEDIQITVRNAVWANSVASSDASYLNAFGSAVFTN